MEVEIFKFFGGNPVFLVVVVSYGVDFKLGDVGVFYLEAGYVAGVVGIVFFGVPFLGDLGGVLFVEDGVEDGLMGEAGREGAVVAGFD